MSCRRHWIGLPCTQPFLCGFAFLTITLGYDSHREDTHLNQLVCTLPSTSEEYSDGQHSCGNCLLIPESESEIQQKWITEEESKGSLVSTDLRHCD